jgi:predicted amidohydrolase YtcJ
MIAAYTINGAYLAHREKQTGSIAVGKDADLIVLSANLFTMPVESIHKVKVLLTLLEGREVFRHSSFPTPPIKSSRIGSPESKDRWLYR